MGVIEGLPLPLITLAIGTLGIPGLVLVLFYAHIQHTAKILAGYREDVAKVTQFYERNVSLVEKYERLATDLKDVITMSTQVNTQLVEQIRNNMFCPMVREKGPHR